MDDTTRRVSPSDELQGRGDELRGRAEEQTRSYATTTSARTTGTNTGDEDLDADSDRRAREIQSEIAHTRAEMSETIDALQEKLRPANIVSDATERVKTATTEKVRSMADTASEAMRETGERAYEIVSGPRQNPYPALMITAGVAWLLYDRSRNKGGNGWGSSRREWSQYSPSSERRYGYGSQDYYRSADAQYSDVDYARTAGSTGVTGTSAYESGTSGYQGTSNYQGGSSAFEGAASRMNEVRDSARQTVRRTQNQLQRMLHENPLLVGAAAVLAGAAIGASLPETQRENQLMGETRDSMIDRAQEAARDAANTVKEAASDPVGVVNKVTEAVKDNKSS